MGGGIIIEKRGRGRVGKRKKPEEGGFSRKWLSKEIRMIFAVEGIDAE